MALPEALVREFEELVSHYPQRRAALIPALHRCQEELGGWISPQAMEDVAGFFELQPVEVYGVVTFYPMFRLQPPGEHVIGVCHNVSCMLRGAEDVIAQLCELTGAPVGGTSKNKRFSLARLECQGACANGPMLDMDGVYHEDLTAARVSEIVAEITGGLE